MPNYRQQLSGSLGTVNACPSCGGGAEPCGTSITIPSGAQGYYNLDFDAGATASDVGAIVIYFNPATIPDGIRVLYDNVFYNTLTNNTNGRIQTTSGVTGAFTIVGDGSDTCVPSAPNTSSYDFFDGIVNGAWNNTGTTQSITINTGDFVGGSISQYSTLVIPKTTATPSIVSLQVLGPCSGTGWLVEVSCPATLPNVSASTAQSTDACQSTQNTSVYFAKNYNDTNTVPIVGNFVFTDGNGATPLNNTSTTEYYITGTIALGVRNGVVVSSATCTSGGSLTPFYVTPGIFTQKEYACDVVCNTLLYHNGTGTLPQISDTIYGGSTTGSQTVSWSDHRGFGNSNGDNAYVTGTTSAQGVVSSTWQCQ